VRHLRLQGKVVAVEPTSESFVDEHGSRQTRYVFTVEITGFSKRTLFSEPTTSVEKLIGKKVKTRRFCFHDWHLKIGSRITLDPAETEAALAGKTDLG